MKLLLIRNYNSYYVNTLNKVKTYSGFCIEWKKIIPVFLKIWLMLVMNIKKNEYLANNPSSLKIQLNLVTEIAFWFSLFILNLGLSYLGF